MRSRPVVIGFPVLYALACAALLTAGNATISAWGFEYVIFAFLIGLAISNSVGVPSWLKGAVRTEYYIKIGKALLTGLRTLWFALAFTSIGLETRFAELGTAQDGRPALAFFGGQAFNVLWTLLLAYVLFGGLFSDVQAFK